MVLLGFFNFLRSLILIAPLDVFGDKKKYISKIGFFNCAVNNQRVEYVSDEIQCKRAPGGLMHWAFEGRQCIE